MMHVTHLFPTARVDVDPNRNCFSTYCPALLWFTYLDVYAFNVASLNTRWSVEASEAVLNLALTHRWP